MKNKKLYYIASILCLALLTAACERSLTEADDAGEGYVEMAFRATETRTISSSYLSLERCTIRIYAKQTAADGSVSQSLVRKYDPGDCPARIKLLAGDYAIRVQCGKAPALASFDDCLYEGTADCTIQSGKTSKVTVTCRPRSSIVQVVFGHFEEEVLNSGVVPSVTLKLLDTATPDSLVYRHGGDNTGYFTVPAQGSRLEWTFRARNAKQEEDLVKTAVLDSLIRPATKYTLTFKYSSDLPGYIYVELTDVDTSTDDSNDVAVFSETPIVEGLPAAINYADDLEVNFSMEAKGNKTIGEGFIYLGESDTGSVLWRWPNDKDDTSRVGWELSEDNKVLKIKLKQEFFAFPIGTSSLYCKVIDNQTVSNDATASVNMDRGVYPVVATDYDLWTNTFTARALFPESDQTPVFKLRKAGTSGWYASETVTGSNGEYTAVFAPKWDEQQNEAGLTVYKPLTECGVYAMNTYEVAVELNGHEYSTSFFTKCDQPIPYANMSNSSLSCFTMDHGDFWDSGNVVAMGFVTTILCKYASNIEDTEGTKWSCANLVGGSPMTGMLGAGNLFAGYFESSGTVGTVNFGQPYDWTARPTALHVKYRAKVGNVNVTRHKEGSDYPIQSGTPDISVIYVAIVDWENPHRVSSGTDQSSLAGIWSPDKTKDPGEGTVIGYGIAKIQPKDANTPIQMTLLEDLEIPIYYYDQVTKPSKNYTLVISSSTSYYGDYMCGCSTNEMYLTDFSWVY